MRLITPRLVLRTFEDRDIAPFIAYRSDPEVAKYQSWDAPYPEEEAIDFVEAMKSATPGIPGDWYQLAIELLATGDIIGDCAFYICDDDDLQAEIGFTLSRAHQGKGYATEAIKRLLDYLFGDCNLHRVRANCEPANIASVKLLKRVGMRCEGHFIKSLWLKKHWVDELWFAILQEEWKFLDYK